tara:strand:- start:1962 stop:3086 length:1125 start_codon:yes stop_codon:yes gene_type:complete
LSTSEVFFNRIQKQYNNKLPFVVYKKPDSEALNALFQTNDEVYKVDTYHETGFVFAPFDATSKSVLIPLAFAEEMKILYSNVKSAATKHTGFSVNQEEKQKHIKLIEQGILSIDNQELQKVVLSRQEVVNISNVNLMSLFEKLLNTYPLAFVYCWYHPKNGLWLGATPETLMKIEGNQFSMMALAGTQEYKGCLDVIWENKEKEEQQIVTDFIIENIKPLAEHIKISEVETVRAGNLLHLKTMVSARIKTGKLNLKEIISDLHPTPAVCGFPKLKAKQFILKHEHYNREFYAGYLGELNYEKKINTRSSKRNIENRAYAVTKKCTQLYVNLRCMQIKDNKALVYVGGGITKESDSEKEWDETVSKSMVIKSILK